MISASGRKIATVQEWETIRKPELLELFSREVYGRSPRAPGKAEFRLLERSEDALDGKALPVYGTGAQIRDWLYVEDHARALYLVATRGVPGETYNIGGHNEKKNIEVVHRICEILDELQPRADGKTYAEQITFVTDRPGHDLRYAIDAAKIRRELGWKPLETFESGIRKTVQWYLDHRFTWCKHVQEGTYHRERLGTGGVQ